MPEDKQQSWFSNVAANASTTALGQLMGIFTGKHNDKRQLKQQRKLQGLQIEGNKEMLDYQQQKEMEMWENTNYGAQKEQMIKAGLNPGLMYGMSGGGGTTIGGGGGGVTGATATQGGGGEMGMGLQLGMMQAQMELIRAQTKKTNVEADNAAGVEKEKTIMETKGLAAGIENTQAKTALTKVEEQLSKLNLAFDKATYDQRIEYIIQQERQMTGLASQALTQANLDTDARSSRLKIIQTQAAQMLLQNALITAQTGATYQSINESNQRIEGIKKDIESKNVQMQKMTEELMIQWGSMSNDQKRTRLQEIMTDWNTDPTNRILEGLIDGLDNLMPKMKR